MAINAPHSVIPGTANERSVFIAERDFEFLRALIHRHTGIHIDKTKKSLLRNRVAERLQELDIGNIKGYLTRLKTEPDIELEQLANAITTNTTSFMRHDYQFEFLANYLSQKANDIKKRGFRIWSAACSTGQEPYSIAWTAAQNLPPTALEKTRIIASDINGNALKKAFAGVYANTELADLPEDYITTGFLRGTGQFAGLAKIKPEIQALVRFHRVNLVADWPWTDRFDIIFCRNVCIYFDRDTQLTLFRRFAELQREGDYLFTGHSEQIPDTCDFYQPAGKSIYRKAG